MFHSLIDHNIPDKIYECVANWEARPNIPTAR
jgi:hypothetical protein